MKIFKLMVILTTVFFIGCAGQQASVRPSAEKLPLLGEGQILPESQSSCLYVHGEVIFRRKLHASIQEYSCLPNQYMKRESIYNFQQLLANGEWHSCVPVNYKDIGRAQKALYKEKRVGILPGSCRVQTCIDRPERIKKHKACVRQFPQYDWGGRVLERLSKKGKRSSHYCSLVLNWESICERLRSRR